MLFHKPPDLTHLKTFGCLCFPLLQPYNTHKLEPRSTPYIFLGYPSHSKGYIYLNPTSHQIYISRHVLFNKIDFLSHLSSQSQPTPSPVTSTFDSIPWLSVVSHTYTPHINSDLLASISAITTPPSITSNPISSSLPTKSGSNTTSPIEPSSNPTPTIESNSYTPSSLESVLPPSSLIESLQSSYQFAIPPTPINTHPMHTRSKNGIYKPKTFQTATLDYTQIEPPTYHTASKFPQWCTAMTEEYTALQR